MQLMFSKFKDGMKLFGTAFMVASIALCVFSAFYHFLFEDSHIKVYLFAVACVLFAAEVIHGFAFTVNAVKTSNSDIVFFQFVFSFSLALDLLTLICYFLGEEKNPRIFAFWLTGTMMSLLVNFASMAFLTFGGMLSCVTLALSFRQLWKEGEILKPVSGKKKYKNIRELRTEKQKLSEARLLKTSVIIALCFTVFWGSMNCFVEGALPFVETVGSNFSQTKLSQTIEKGPHKGVKTTAEMKKTYQDILADLDVIKADSAGQPFYVAGNCSFYYLYLNLPFGTYSTWYVTNDSQTRQLRYWELHPEKKPKYCYVPLYVDSLCFTNTWEEEQERIDAKLEFFESIADCTCTKARAGYIVKINHWK